MSIVRVGLGETKKFAEGYEAIFGKKDAKVEKKDKKEDKDEAAQPKKKKEKKK